MPFKKLLFAAITALGFVSAAQANVLNNSGFETGNTSGWSVTGPSTGSCAQNFVAGSTGAASNCVGFGPYGNFVAPHSGTYAAYASFDGGGPLSHTLTQTFAVPLATGNATLSWWDALGFGNGWMFPQARVYTVDLLNGSGGVVANVLTQSYTNQPGGIFQDWTSHSVDISPFLASLSGQSAQLRFNLYVPQAFTGPGVFALDDVSIDTVAVPEPVTLLLFGLGLCGLLIARRRQ